MNQKEIVKNIETVYPFRIVSDLKSTDENLYMEVSKAAKDKKSSVKTFVEELGFKYSRKPLGAICAEDVETLNKLFPDKEIKALSDVDGKLYYKLLTHAKLLNMDIKRYLNFLGFNYMVQKEEVTKESLISELNKIYKDKKITKLSVNQPQLYSKIYKFAQKENIPITKLVESFGFSIDLEENYKNNRRKSVNKKNNSSNTKSIKNAKVTKKSSTAKTKETITKEKNNKPLENVSNVKEKVEAKKTGKVGRPKKVKENETVEVN